MTAASDTAPALAVSIRLLARNRLALVGALIVGAAVITAILAPVLPLYDPIAIDLDNRLLRPISEGHLLGTDHLGRDIVSRLLWGARVSLAVAVIATVAAAVVGSAIGIIAGYAGRLVDSSLMRSIDVLMAFPYLLLALAIVAALGPGLLNALIAVAIVNVPLFARAVRGATLGEVGREYVAAARLAGFSHMRVVTRELLPNVTPTIVITMASTIGWMILETAGLSFLGLGAQPPNADLGSMLGEGRKLFVVAPHVATIPGIAIFVLVVGINVLADGVRDAIDPRLKSGALARPAARTDRDPNWEPPKTQNEAILAVTDLSTWFLTGDETVYAAERVSFSLKAGEGLALVGESGSGKSVTALSILGLVPSPPGVIVGGSVRYHDEELIGATMTRLRELRGGAIAYVFQDPGATFNPLFTVGGQIAEAIRAHGDECAREDVTDLFEAVDLPDPLRIYASYPHELSGGQLQRAAIAMALANEPEVLIADEPTTALDVTTQARILELLNRLRGERGMALVFITHDLAVAASVAERVVVMRKGEVVEEGPMDDLLKAPQSDYARKLVASVPRLGAPDRLIATGGAMSGDPLLVVDDLSVHFGGLLAVDGVHLKIGEGESLGLVGESGSGKSTIARAIAGLVTPSGGSIRYRGRALGPVRSRDAETRRQVQMVFQTPSGSLNPRRRVRGILTAPLRVLLDQTGEEAEERARELLSLVHLDTGLLERYPHELSGGQAQRIAIARAMAADPSLVILDEPTSALDVTVQAEVLRLLDDLRRDRNFAYLFISHDLAVVEAMCARVAVLKSGVVVETGNTREVLSHPHDDYTQSLVDSVPALPVS